MNAEVVPPGIKGEDVVEDVMRNHALISHLRKLQARQYKHDQAAHQDIFWSPVQRRLTHYTLHFSKYVGALVRAHRQEDVRVKQKVITDSVVIVLATANTMNVDLQRRIESGVPGTSGALTPTGDERRSFATLVLRYAEVVGEMSKACEAMDHVEDYPSRAVLERSVLQLVSIISCLADIESMELISAVTERWKMIEQKLAVARELDPEYKSSTLSVAA